MTLTIIFLFLAAGVSLSSGMSISPSPPSPPLLTEARSDDEKAIQELRSMLTASMEARDRADLDKKVS